MARPKEFDPDKALEKAMTLFWQKGYEATSIQDLVDHLGIGSRSLYDTFKSKHDLFIAAFDRYREITATQPTLDKAELTSPKEIIQAIFETVIDEALNDPHRCGCFFVNAAVELAPHDDAVAVRVREATQHLEDTFYYLLDQAQKNGDLSTNQNPRELAQFLSHVIFGMRVQAKINPDKEILTHVMNLALSVLH